MGNLVFGCIADDFTGASDAASFLVAGGLRTVLTNGVPPASLELPADVQAVVVALKSRTIPSREAVSLSRAAAGWLLGHGARQLFFKYCSTFDSTAEGNIGPVTDALMEMTGADFTIVCPALPVNGRVVRNGILYVNGVPLSESPMKDHPLTPMRDSSICSLMQAQSRYACRSLVWSDFPDQPSARAAVEAHREVFGRAGTRFTLAVDFADAADAERIADLFHDLPLLTGGSGILTLLAARLAAPAASAAAPTADGMPLANQPGKAALGAVRTESNGQSVPNRRQTEPGAQAATENQPPRLLLAGSCSDMTRRQVRHFLAAGGLAVKVSPLALLCGEQTEAGVIGQVLAAGRDILVYSSAEADEVRQNQAHGLETVSDLLEGLMGRIARAAVDAGFRRIVVAGGETSGAVTRALGFASFYIGPSVAPGVPEMEPTDRPEIRIVLKSGNFGQEDFFGRALA